MSTMDNSRAIVMLDTNIWLDYYLPTRPSSEASTRVITMCGAKGYEIVYALHSLHDVFWLIQRDSKAWVTQAFGSVPERYAKAAKAEAWGCINHMLKVGTPIGADVSDARRAVELQQINSDFEDNMILVAAERAHANYLVSSDEHLRNKAPVAALAPKDMLALLKVGI